MFLVPETCKDKMASEMHLLSTWRRTGSIGKHPPIIFASRMEMDQLLSLSFPSSVTKEILLSFQPLVTLAYLLIFILDQRFSLELLRLPMKKTTNQVSKLLKTLMNRLS